LTILDDEEMQNKTLMISARPGAAQLETPKLFQRKGIKKNNGCSIIQNYIN